MPNLGNCRFSASQTTVFRVAFPARAFQPSTLAWVGFKRTNQSGQGRLKIFQDAILGVRVLPSLPEPPGWSSTQADGEWLEPGNRCGGGSGIRYKFF